MLRVYWCPMAEISCCRAGRWHRAGFEGWEKRWPSPRWKDAAFDTFWTVFLAMSVLKSAWTWSWAASLEHLECCPCRNVSEGLGITCEGYKYTFWQAWCLAVRKWAQVFPTIRRQPGFSTADNLSTTRGSLYLALSALFATAPCGSGRCHGLWSVDRRFVCFFLKLYILVPCLFYESGILCQGAYRWSSQLNIWFAHCLHSV